MTKYLRLLAILPLLFASSVGGDESKAIRAFKKAFQSTARAPKPAAEREAAVALLDGYDSKNIAKVLIWAYDVAEEEVLALDAQRLANIEEFEQLEKFLNANKRRFADKKQQERWRAINGSFAADRDRIDALRSLQFALRARLGKLRQPASLEFALKQVIGKKKYSVSLQLAVARAAGSAGETMLGPLQTALGRARKTLPRLALLDGIALLDDKGKPAAPVVMKLLSDKDADVRERAALALCKMLVPEAIEPVIGLMLRSEGARKRRLAGALEIMTRQEFGEKASTWQNWWAKEKDKYLSGAVALGGGKVSSHEKHNRENYYFGIPQEGKAIMYVIDASGSMKHPVDLKIKGTAAVGSATTQTRLEACKKELIRALGKLDPKVKFNIVWYSSMPHEYKPTMNRAAKPTVADAQGWVRKLQPAGSTNIHDSLQRAFKQIGRGARDKAYAVELDTIFLLTDGTPTRPDGTLDSTEKIIKAVRDWNPLKRVTIHCIGIGGQLNSGFLQQLAQENGGEFKRY